MKNSALNKNTVTLKKMKPALPIKRNFTQIQPATDFFPILNLEFS